MKRNDEIKFKKRKEKEKSCEWSQGKVDELMNGTPTSMGVTQAFATIRGNARLFVENAGLGFPGSKEQLDAAKQVIALVDSWDLTAPMLTAQAPSTDVFPRHHVAGDPLMFLTMLVEKYVIKIRKVAQVYHLSKTWETNFASTVWYQIIRPMLRDAHLELEENE